MAATALTPALLLLLAVTLSRGAHQRVAHEEPPASGWNAQLAKTHPSHPFTQAQRGRGGVPTAAAALRISYHMAAFYSRFRPEKR